MPHPPGIAQQIWRLYGFKSRDVLFVVLALPAGLQVLAPFFESLNLTDLARRFISVWREATRAIWGDLFAWVGGIIHIELDFSAPERDALTLALLAGAATLSALVFRRGESLQQLAKKSRHIDYGFAVRVLKYPLVLALFLGTALLFFHTAEIDLGEAGVLWWILLGLLLTLSFATFLLWWSLQGEVQLLELAIEAAKKTGRISHVTHPLGQLRLRRKARDQWLRELGPQRTETGIRLEVGLSQQYHPNFIERMEAERDQTLVLTRGVLICLIVLLCASILAGFGYGWIGLDRPQSVFVYLIALTALAVCTWLNWKAFPIIYANALILVALNAVTATLGVFVAYLNDVVTKVGD